MDRFLYQSPDNNLTVIKVPFSVFNNSYTVKFAMLTFLFYNSSWIRGLAKVDTYSTNNFSIISDGLIVLFVILREI